MKNVLVLAVHPDDETLGCGGALLAHKAAGDKIHWLIGTDMDPKLFPRERIDAREREIRAVADAYGFDSVHRLGLPAVNVDRTPMADLVGMVSNVIAAVRPDTFYLPFKSDVHSDHRVLFQAAYSCTKAFRYPFLRELLMMEVLSETEFAPATKEEAFIPTVFQDVTRFMEKKLEIMAMYEGESGVHPFPRSPETIRALARLRGAQAGTEYAEGFALLKQIRP